MINKMLLTLSGVLTLSELISITKGYIEINREPNEEVLSKKQCHYNGRRYRTGRFQVAPCVWCDCSQEGEITCWAATCPKEDQECIKYNLTPGECCPRCVEYGCQYNDTFFKRGENIPTHDPCKKCYCPWTSGSGGQSMCLDIHCSPVHCVDSFIPTGKCCPSCPNGNNCWLKENDLIIPTGRQVWIDKCHLCHCPNVTTSGAYNNHLASSFDWNIMNDGTTNNIAKMNEKLRKKTTAKIIKTLHAICVYQKSYACDQES